MTQTVLDNVAKMECAHPVKSHAYRVMTKHAEVTVVAMEEIVNLLLNAKADSVACTFLSQKICW